MNALIDDTAQDYIKMEILEDDADIVICQKSFCGASVMPWQITCPGCGSQDFHKPNPAPTYVYGNCGYDEHESLDDADLCCAACFCG